jgi:cyclase
MSGIRVIARLDVKPPDVVKGVHFEGWRKMGKPEDLAVKYYQQGADEIFYIDCVASLFQRGIMRELVEKTSRNIFVPFCVGGGIRTVDDAAALLHSGADKVVMNTSALGRPELIRESAAVFGNQCVTVSVEAKRWDGWWECYTDHGRIRTGRNVLDWVREAEALGAGEFFVTSVDADGRRRGFDIDLMRKVSEAVTVPVVAGGGAGTIDHIEQVIKEARVDGVALASVLHYDLLTVSRIKEGLRAKGIEVEL